MTALALGSLLACSGSSSDDDGSSDPITTALRIVVSSSVPVRGVQVDLRHDSRLSVTDVTSGAAFAGASCAENVTDGRVQLGCAAGSDVVAPFTGWTLEVRHSSSLDPEDAVTSLTCTASDATGNHVTATCSVE